MRYRPLLALPIVAALLLSGCAALAFGGLAAGAAVAHDRRTTGTMLEDQNIEIKAAAALARDPELKSRAHLNVTSYNLVVLLSGEAPSEELKLRAGRIVRGIERVRRVHNEVVVAAPSSMMTRSSDTMITARVKTALLGVKGLPGFDATRVKVVTENGTVFLMGIVTRAEADAATEAARTVGGVQRVVRLFEYLDH
jgi:osmotically-inducible protein OsmY